MQTTDLRGARLSLQQTRLWSLQEDPQIFRVQCSLLLEGPLNIEKLQGAFKTIIARHEILRTAFRQIAGVNVPLQIIAEQAEFIYCELSLEELSEEKQQEELEHLFTEEQTTPFTFSQYPLLRVSVFHLHAARHILLLSLPALCADAVSLRIFAHLVFKTYSLLPEHQELDDDLLQYIDVAAWQQELLQNEDAEEHMLFWKESGSADFSCSLPFHSQSASSVRPSKQFCPLEYTYALDADCCRNLLLLSQTHNISCEAILLACWQILCWRFTGDPQIQLGYLCNGRFYEELSDALGAYSRVVPLSYSFHPARSFIYLAQHCQQSIEVLQEHQYHFSWSLLNEAADHFLPLGFSFDAWPMPGQQGPLHWRLLRSYHLLDRFLLHLDVLQNGETFSLSFRYEPQAFTPVQVQRLAHALLKILRVALDQPQRVLAGWPVLEEIEQQQLLQRFQGVAPTDSRSLLDCFEDYASRHPDQPAVRCGEIQISYQQLNVQANRLAHWLRRNGVCADGLVALYLERGVEMLVGVLGVLKAGGAYVPVETTWPRERLRLVLGELTPLVVLTQSTMYEQVPEGSWQIKALDQCSWLEGEEESNMAEVADAQCLAYVLFTSGSTGMPKGVGVRRESLRHYTAALRKELEVQEGWQYALVSTLAADLGNTVIYGALTGGGCLHILSYEVVIQGRALAEYMQRFKIDVLKIVPSHLQAMLLDESEQAVFLPRCHLILGGEALSWELLDRVKQADMPCKVWNHYGPTETTIGVLLQPLGSADECARGERVVPLGKPIGGNTVYIADAWQQIVPVGVVGELYIAGKGLARGYLERPEETAGRFVPHPYGRAGERVYRTGDLARYTEDGGIEFIGRKDRQVKIRGYRVELGEVEAALQEHEQVREAIVQLRGERLIGYVLAQQPLPTGLELCQWVGSRLPEYMVPAAIVRMLAWPLTTNGKINLQGLPEPEEEQERVIVEARTVVEELLMSIWREVLHVQAISVYDDFFHLDGHSLLATQVISRVRQVFNVNISIRRFFERPTLAGLAEEIEQSLRADPTDMTVPPLLPASRDQDLPLSFAQQRLWFLAQLDPQSTAYNLPHALRLLGPLQRDVLEACFLDLATRHEVLRTTFELREGQPVQCIHEPQGPVVQFLDLAAWEEQRREEEVRRLVAQEVGKPFDLETGPVWRVVLVCVGEQEHLLLLTLHHIVSDGWSSQVLVEEICQLYAARLRGEPSPLTALPVQYADYALWQREWLQGERLQQQERYWQQHLAGLRPLELPTDHRRPAQQGTRGALAMRRFPLELSQQVHELARQEGVTLFMLLLAAFQVVLARYSGQEDIAVGTPIANRTRAEIEGVIGFFVNTLVLRTDVSGTPTFREVLRRVREVSLGAYAHQDLPFEYLVELLQPERDPSRHPLIQVMFGLQNIPGTTEVLEGIQVEMLPFEQQSAKFDLNLMIRESAHGIVCSLEYNADLYERETIARLLERYQAVLQGLVADVEQSAFHLPSFLLPTEQAALSRWHQTARAYPLQQSFAHLWQQQVRAHASATALVCGEQRLSYEQVARQVQHLARFLRQQGVGAEQIVAVRLERSVGWLVSLLALLQVGAVYLPLEPSLPAERVRVILQQARPRLLLTEANEREEMEALAGADLKVCCLPEPGEEQEEQEEEPLCFWPEHLAYVLYTSGSTGLPKGAMISQQGLLNHLLAKVDVLGLTSADRVGQSAASSFDISLWQALAVVLVGGAVVLFSEEQRQDPEAFCELVQREQLSVVEVVPSFLQAIVEPSERLESWASSLRWLVVTGEALSGELADRWLGRYPQVPLLNAYGPTECADDVTHQVVRVQDRTQGRAGEPVPLGRALPNTQLSVVDRWGMQAPVGVMGEVYVGGVGVGRGYLAEPGKTAESFVPDSWSGQPGARLYRTGDLGRYREDGVIEFVGRRDQQIKLRGYRIELGEIEAVLALHPCIEACAV
ncbi:MAG TPA: amino acid adenylation domain-containing protein, partial [Ktedonobacteraceae bacterium]|nr:amino acid adenylation domain-containing protein [Ktedonobacteraceae bacterium]